MNNDRTILLENVAGCPVMLADTQGRKYNMGKDGKIRISSVSLADILDFAPSKVFFTEGKMKIRNISANELYNMGLTDEEIALFLVGEEPAVVITPVIEEKPYEEVKEEVIIPVIEEVKEEVVETPVVEEKLVTKSTATAKKATNKKPAAKKSSSLKTK